MKPAEVAESFSNGQFESIYTFLADTIEWDIVGEDFFKGKAAVIQNCKEVSEYFKTVSTNFTTRNIIVDANKVVINGTAEFLKDNKRVAFVFGCDIYEFNDDNLIQKITSYCIQPKE